MKLDKMVNFIGMLSVVAGLVFVGFEMRQSQQIALAAQQQSRTEIFTGIVNSLNESSDASLYQIFRKTKNNETLTLPERKVAENYAFQAVWVFENDFIQFKSGLIGDEVWEAKLRGINAVAAGCAYRNPVEYLMQYMTVELTSLVDIKPRSECAVYQ